MLLSMSPGTLGNGDECYGLYLPFEIPDNRALGMADGSAAIEIAGTPYKLEQLHHRYALRGGAFSTTAEATAQLAVMRICLLWFSLKRRVGVRYPDLDSQPRMYDEPIALSSDVKAHALSLAHGWREVHGDYDADKAMVLPQHLCLTRFEGGRVGVHLGLGVDDLQSIMQEASGLPHIATLHHCPKLRIAIELYASNHFEASNEARFLTLVAALEATLESEQRGAVAQTAICEMKRVIQERVATSASDEESELTNLLDAVGRLKQRSIGQRFRAQIGSRAKDLVPDEDLDKRLSMIYGIRSRLLHDGRASQNALLSGLDFLNQFVPLYLTHEFRRAAGAL